MNVSHTCRDWRDIVLSTGILWSCLKIRYHREESNAKEVLENWLERSHASPLCYDISIFLTGIKGDKCLARVTAKSIALSMLQQQKRWKDIRIYLRADTDLSSALQSVGAVEMPRLTSLWWTFLNSDCVIEKPETWSRTRIGVDITSSRHLKRLYLNGPFELKVGSAPIESLTECFDIFNRAGGKGYTQLADMEMCLALLRIAPNLKRFKGIFQDYENIMADAAKVGPVLTLPQLRIAYLESNGLRDSGLPILNRLTLPGLEALSLISEDRSTGPMFLDCIVRSPPPLTFLDIVGEGIQADTLSSALRHLPALKELRVSFMYLRPGTLLEALTINGDANTHSVDVQLCPSLEAFWMLDVYGIDGEEERLSLMIASRWRFSKAFLTAGIASECDEDRILESHGIRECIEEGLGLYF
ncbi:hypothetical protein M0805_000232 [Coniferiporia weirii]|nr:hypothetical protein M0805_000232 [Coniferiporia weirii]